MGNRDNRNQGIDRRNFLKKASIGGFGLSTLGMAAHDSSTSNEDKPVIQNPYEGQPSYSTHFSNDAKLDGWEPDKLVIERARKGKPHQGKVLLAIQAHSDDVPLFAGGTVAKLMDEGYTGYLLRTSDDSAGDVEGNRRDNQKIAEAFGMEKAYDFMYDHHRMDSFNIQDLKGRLTFLFRLLKVDTIVCWDPYGHYEENPDHRETAKAVEVARWHAGGTSDYPEHFDAGLEPHSPKEVYYYARSHQKVNRIVDISDYIDKKAEVNMLNVTKGPSGKNGQRLKERLAAEGKRLPILGNTDYEANFNYTKHFVFDIDARRLNFRQPSNKKLGEMYGLKWAERFNYKHFGNVENNLEKYIAENSEDL